MTDKFHNGDRVLFRFRWFDRTSPDVDKYTCGVAREGVVKCTARGGKLLKIYFLDLRGVPRIIWRRSWRVKLVDRSISPVVLQRPSLVDARVLEEVVALQYAVGGTDALLDLLQDIRKTYEPEAKEGA